MKKTLIALAVLAVSGASFAQVTITGNVTMGYQAKTAAAIPTVSTASDSSGLGIDTTLLTFTAKEDLGAGMTAGAEMKIDGLNRGGIAGGDSMLYVGGGFGKITLSNGRGGDYLSGGISGVGGMGMDGKVFSALTAADAISYTLPTIVSGLTIALSHDEAAPRQLDEPASPTSPIGLGVGAAGQPARADYQRGNNIGLTYRAGAIAANLSYKMYDMQGSAALGDGNNSKDRISLAGSYDLGVAKLGAGYRYTQNVTGKREDALVSVGVPMGALTLGANYATRKQSGRVARTFNGSTDFNNGTATGYSLKAEYALSKRTSLIASYASWDQAVSNSNDSTETNLWLSHSF